jgi:hypothetical protein
VTRHLSLEDADATRSMRQDGLDTAATRALRARPIPVPPSRSVPPARATPPPQPRERTEGEDPRRKDRRRNLTTFLALIGLIAAVAAIGLVLISSMSSNNVQSVDRADVQNQIQGLRDFLNEHSR